MSGRLEGVSPMSVILRVFLQDSSSAVGAGLAGLAYNTSGLNISLIKDGSATVVTYTSAATNIEDISTLGTYAAPSANKCRFKEIDATNLKGFYELQFADAVFQTTDGVSINIGGATNLAQCPLRIDTKNLAANMTQISGSAVVATTAQVGANVVQISGDATAADNAEAMFDGSGYDATASSITAGGAMLGSGDGGWA